LKRIDCSFEISILIFFHSVQTTKQDDSVKTPLLKLADKVSKFLKNLAPVAYRRMVQNSRSAHHCRIGFESDAEDRPFSSVSCCVNYCAHSHRDSKNVANGVTAVSLFVFFFFIYLCLVLH
jgi:hypothetical protein